MRRAAVVALALLVGCGGDGDAASISDGEHVGTVSMLQPDSFRLVFEGEELVIDDDIKVRLLVPCCELHDVPFDEWLAGFEGDERTFYGTSRSQYRIIVEDGRVLEVEEVRAA